jgi:hypothetical protein
LGDTGCSCRHYSISRIVFKYLPSLDSIIARRRPLRAQYERTPRHCKRELLGCMIRNDTVLPFLDDFKTDLYIYQKLKQAQTFWWVGVVRISKSQRSLARCPQMKKLGFGNAERHGRSLGFRHSNRLPQLYLNFPYTVLYSYTSALLPFQLVARNPSGDP